MVYLSGTSTLSVCPESCTGCGVCLEVCPREVLKISNAKAEIANLDACIECGACQMNCRFSAITVRAGVGCASALIDSLKNGGPPACGCSDDGEPGCC